VKLFTFMILLSTLSTLVPYTFCALASLVSGRAAGSTRPGLGMTIVSGLALAYSLVAIVGAGSEAVIWGAVLLVVGVPVFYWMRSSRARVLA
jgi:APA family basic amino acid/polyamine antiporter